MNIFKNIKNNKGFVILFAVTLAALFLAMALSILNVAFREVKFGTNARDTNDAFFAADTGVECAQYYDRTPTTYSNAFSGASPMNCAGVGITVKQRASDSYWTFAFSGLGISGKGCAQVIVDKTGNGCGVAGSPDCIISKGYNNATVSEDKCLFVPNAVEREIKVIY